MSKLYECKISRFLIVTLLIICIVSASFCVSTQKADALVLNPWTIALCGTILCAAGLTFSDSSAMESVVSSFWPQIPDLVKDDLQAKASEYEASNDNDFFLTLGADLIAAISGWLSGVTAAEGGSVIIPSGTSSLDISSLTSTYTTVATYPIDYFICNSSPSWDDFFFPTDLTIGFCLYPTGYNSNYHCYYARSDSNVTNNINLWRTEQLTSSTVELRIKKDSSSMLTLGLYESSWNGIVVSCPYSVSGSLPSSIGVKGLSTSIPFSDVWAPGSSDEEKALVAGTDVVVPGGLVNSDGVLESDVIVGMSASNVRANSGANTDSDVAVGTGTISGTGSGTGIFEGVGALDLVFGIPILGDILKALLTGFELLAGLISSIFSSPIEWLKELLNTIWNAITSGFEAVLNWGNSLWDGLSDFFSKVLQFFKDILAALADFLTGIVAFIPDILAWLASYTLFSDLLNKFLPQPVAVVFISFFLASIAIWLFRMIANR